MGKMDRIGRIITLCILSVLVQPLWPAHAASPGPVKVTARGVEFRSHDETTGALRVHLVAESASMAGDVATLVNARLARYDGSGRLALEVRAREGSYTGGRGARLLGGVEVEWHLAPPPDKTGGGAPRGATVLFSCGDIAWDEASDSFKTDSAVRGRVFGREPGGRSAVDLEGRGFAFVTAESRGEILRDAVVRMDGRDGAGFRGAAAFRATADGGLVFESTPESTAKGDGPAGRDRRTTGRRGAGGLFIRMRGPVATVSGGSSARADRLDLRFVPGENGELELEGGVFSGTVRAFVLARDNTQDGRGGAGALLPGSFVPRLLADRPGGDPKAAAADERTELRAAVIEVSVASGGLVLHGTLSDPARVIFEGGELRGTRIDLTEGRITTDGGATSEFVW